MIKLFDNYVILVDKYNYSLAKFIGLRKNKNGEEEKRFDYIAHCNSLAEALKSFRRYLIKQNLSDGDMSLFQALQRIKKIDEEVEKFISDNIPQI